MEKDRKQQSFRHDEGDGGHQQKGEHVRQGQQGSEWIPDRKNERDFVRDRDNDPDGDRIGL